MKEKDKINFEFRTASPGDAELICELVNSVYRGENSRKGWTTEADFLDGIRINTAKVNELIRLPDNVILVVSFNNKIIGCVQLEKNGSKCHLGMLSVDVKYQNSGIGRMLMDKSEDYAVKDLGCDEMEMKVIGRRTELIDYYLRRGYTKTGEREPFVLNTHFGEPKAGDLYFEYMVKKLSAFGPQNF